MNALQQVATTSPTADLVILHDGELVTSTIAIAAGTANSHESAIKLVRTHQNDFEEFGLVRFEIEPRKPGQHGGGDTEYALLNEDQATLLITYMRNNVIVRKFKVSLVRNFSDMRRRLASSALPNFEDPIASAEAWIAAKKEALAQTARADVEASKAAQLEHQVAELAPAAAGLDLIAGTDGAMCITDAAKTLQMQPYKLRDTLLEMKWMYRRQGKGGFVAYQPTIHSGYLVHKVGNYEDPETGERKTNAQVMVTRKGLTQLSKLIGAPPAPPSPRPNRLN